MDKRTKAELIKAIKSKDCSISILNSNNKELRETASLNQKGTNEIKQMLEEANDTVSRLTNENFEYKKEKPIQFVIKSSTPISVKEVGGVIYITNLDY